MLPNTNDPDYWIEELRPLTDDLDFAFRLAVPEAHRFFTEFRGKPVNRPVLSNLIRYYVLEYLLSQGFDGKEDDVHDGWGFRGLPNNGIELLYKQSCIRIRKGVDPPFPTTVSSQEFYQQSLFEQPPDGIKTNLLILYNLDQGLQYTGSLRILRPTKINIKKKTVTWQWARTVTPNAVDPGKSVSPVYMHGSDLPLEDQMDNKLKKTGTDDADSNVD